MVALKFRKNKNTGFTLMEIIIVVLVVGAMAALSLSGSIRIGERIRAAEGVQILTALLLAQKDFELETGSFSNNLGALDIEFDAGTAAYFNWPPALGSGPIAQVTRIGGGYTLSIAVDGTITCAGAGCGGAGY